MNGTLDDNTYTSLEIDDGESENPLQTIIDSDGIHITQTDNMGLEDHVSLSWGHLEAILDVLEDMNKKYEQGTYNVRHQNSTTAGTGYVPST